MRAVVCFGSLADSLAIALRCGYPRSNISSLGAVSLAFFLISPSASLICGCSVCELMRPSRSSRSSRRISRDVGCQVGWVLETSCFVAGLAEAVTRVGPPCQPRGHRRGSGGSLPRLGGTCSTSTRLSWARRPARTQRAPSHVEAGRLAVVAPRVALVGRCRHMPTVVVCCRLSRALRECMHRRPPLEPICPGLFVRTWSHGSFAIVRSASGPASHWWCSAGDILRPSATLFLLPTTS